MSTEVHKYNQSDKLSRIYNVQQHHVDFSYDVSVLLIICPEDQPQNRMQQHYRIRALLRKDNAFCTEQVSHMCNCQHLPCGSVHTTLRGKNV